MGSEPLSQAEIDQLLKAISSGDDDQEEMNEPRRRKIKIYDFKRPDRFSREELRRMSNIGELFAKKLSLLFNSKQYGKDDVHIHIASVDQLTYEECIRSFPCPSPFTVCNFNNQEMIIEVDPFIVFDLCGIHNPPVLSKGKLIEAKMTNRVLTSEEVKKYNKLVLHPIIRLLKKSFSAYENLKTPTINKIKYFDDPYHSDKSPLEMGQMYCLLTFEFRAETGKKITSEGCFNIGFDWRIIKKLMKEINGEKEIKVAPKDIGLNPLMDTKLPIEVKLGSASKTLKEISKMGEGTIIELDKLAGEPCDITCNGKTIAKGEVVVLEENFGVRIVEILK